MNYNMLPGVHPNPWVDLTRDYVTDTVGALASCGLRVDRSWLDPVHPRDATIVYRAADATVRALVWDEETGWRTGEYVHGEPGVRTELADVSYLGGGVLATPGEVAGRLHSSAAEPRRTYRSMRDVRDGLDDALRRY